MKVIVIGTGFGSGVMAPAWRACGCEVVSLSSRDGEAIDAALGEGADLVSVHSPPFLHRDHVGRAFERGIPVLCDKPFGLDTQAAGAMLVQASTLGLPHFVNFELRFQPARAKAKALVAAGAIGALTHVSWTMFGNGLRAKPWGWLADAAQGGGWLGAYGAHTIDFLRWLTGSEVTQCGGIGRIEVPFREDAQGTSLAATAEDAFSAWLTLGGGVTAMIDSGFSGSVALPERVLLLGSEGALELLDDWQLVLHPREGREERWEFPQSREDRYGPAFATMLPAIRSALAGARPDGLASFDDGLAVTRVLDRLKVSAATVRSEQNFPGREKVHV